MFISLSIVIFSFIQLVTSEQINLISHSNLFVDVSLENTYVDPGAICVNGFNESKARTEGDVNLQYMGHYPVTYTCPYGTKATRHVIVGPAICYMLWYPVCCGGKTYPNDCEANADACFIHNKGECIHKYCTIVDCAPGFEKVGMDKKGCNGTCVGKQSNIRFRLHSKYDTTTSIVLIVISSTVVLGIYLLLTTLRTT